MHDRKEKAKNSTSLAVDFPLKPDTEAATMLSSIRSSARLSERRCLCGLKWAGRCTFYSSQGGLGVKGIAAAASGTGASRFGSCCDFLRIGAPKGAN